MPIHNILYLNAHLFKGTLSAFFYRKLQYNDNERCNMICDYILNENYDIVILSEVWSKKMKQKFDDKLSISFPHSIVPAKNGPWYKLGPEHIIFSKYPITSFVSENLKNLSGWDKFSVKQICGLLIDDVFICTSHFDGANVDFNVKQTCDFIMAHSENRECVLVGDFNMRELSYEEPPVVTDGYNIMFHALNNIGFYDATRILYPNYLANRCYTVMHEENPVATYFNPSDKTNVRIDYFFTRYLDPLNSTIITQNFSDHYAIALKI